MSFAIAKLVPGTNGNPDEWQNYVSRKATATATGSPGAATPPGDRDAGHHRPEAHADELAAAGLGPQLVYNADGYYTYTFSADITDPAWSATINKAAYSTPTATHRVAIQLSYKNAAGEVIRVNPHFDFRFVRTRRRLRLGAAHRPATQDYVMTDVSSCNTCHEKLALHGGGRVDTQYCVMCHNPGTTDPDSGNVLTMSTMTHKIHAGRGLARQPGRRALHHLGLQQRQVRLFRDRLPAGAAELRQVPHGAEPEARPRATTGRACRRGRPA